MMDTIEVKYTLFRCVQLAGCYNLESTKSPPKHIKHLSSPHCALLANLTGVSLVLGARAQESADETLVGVSRKACFENSLDS